MLALIDNQLATLSPVLTTDKRLFVLEDVGGRLQLRLAGKGVIEAGVTFYKMDGPPNAIINPRTGVYKLKRGQTARFRAVFAGQHCDLKMTA